MKRTKDTFILGTSIKITTVLERNTPDSVKITIVDPSENVKVNAVVMTQHDNNVYSYVYQSASTDEDGFYYVTISATYSTYTAVDQATFEMVEQEP